MTPNREIEKYLRRFIRKQSYVENQHDEVCRKINRLNSEEIHLAEYSNKFDSRIYTCEQWLEESNRCFDASSNRQLENVLRGLMREKRKVEAQRSKIQYEKESLEFNADNLLTRSLKWQNRIELYQRALDGEDVPIWAEIQRFENEESEDLCRDKPSCHKKGKESN